MRSVPPERALDGSALDFGIPTGHATRDVVSHWPEAVSRYRTRQLTNVSMFVASSVIFICGSLLRRKRPV
jgi:hypothetical protein